MALAWHVTRLVILALDPLSQIAYHVMELQLVDMIIGFHQIIHAYKTAQLGILVIRALQRREYVMIAETELTGMEKHV